MIMKKTLKKETNGELKLKSVPSVGLELNLDHAEGSAEGLEEAAFAPASLSSRSLMP